MTQMNKKLSLKEIEAIVCDMSIDNAIQKLYSFKEEYGTRVDKLIIKYEKKKLVLEKELKRFEDMCHYEKEDFTDIRI
jgi:ribonuclease HII